MYIQRIEIEKNEVISFRFFVEAKVYSTNAHEEVVSGSTDMLSWSEDWVFIRSNSVKTKPGVLFLLERCPNCSAPLQLVQGKCMYCNVWVSSGQYGWVLQDIKKEYNLLSSWESRGVKVEELVENQTWFGSAGNVGN